MFIAGLMLAEEFSESTSLKAAKFQEPQFIVREGIFSAASNHKVFDSPFSQGGGVV